MLLTRQTVSCRSLWLLATAADWEAVETAAAAGWAGADWEAVEMAAAEQVGAVTGVAGGLCTRGVV